MIRQAAILCGGRGRRLGAITADTPKPLLPVGDGPFLDVLVFELARHGIRKILLLVGFHALKIIDYAESTAKGPIWVRDHRISRTATGGHRRRAVARA